MNDEAIYVGIAAILASGVSLFIPDTALPRKLQEAQERIARIWGLTRKQLKIVECTCGALFGLAIIAISIFAVRNPP